jgi:hypothetical protein
MLSTAELRDDIVQDKQESPAESAENYKEKFLVWVEPATIHGLPNIFREKSILVRVIWIIATMAATGLCVYMLTQSIIDYLRFEVVTKIELIEDTSTTVPQITICSSSLFVSKESQCKNINYYQKGNCFKFNSGYMINGSVNTRLESVSQNSQGTGLIVELFVGNELNTLSSYSGVHIFINNNSVRVNSLLGFGAEPGTFSYVAINKKVTELLPHPYNDCVEDFRSIDGNDSDLFRVIVNSSFSYKQETCYSVYQQKNITTTCG